MNEASPFSGKMHLINHKWMWVGVFFSLLLYLIPRIFPDLPFGALLRLDAVSFWNGILWIISRIHLSKTTSENVGVPHGPWVSTMDLSEYEFHHLERYCEAPTLDDRRDPNEDLLGMQMLIRHGDRGALFNVKSSSHMNCPFSEDQQELPALFLSYHDKTSSLSRESSSAEFSFVPQKAKCLNGELTDKGVLQHLELGATIRRRIGTAASEWIKPDMLVYSTRYPRTYQSALAFMHGAEPSWKPGPNHVLVTPKHDHNFCNIAGTCNCPSYTSLYKKYIQLKKDYFGKDPEIMKLVSEMNSVLNHHLEASLDDWPAHVFDVLLQFACHGRQIPCHHGTCITYHQIVKIVTILENLAADLTSVPSVRQLTVLEGYGLLKIMSDNLQNVVYENFEDNQHFNLFSAHDTTVVPVMHALGLPFHIVIPYASHVIIEVYALRSEPEREKYVRVLHNGEDVTMKTLFAGECSVETSRCPFRVFKEFIDGHLKNQFENACRKLYLFQPDSVL